MSGCLRLTSRKGDRVWGLLPRVQLIRINKQDAHKQLGHLLWYSLRLFDVVKGRVSLETLRPCGFRGALSFGLKAYVLAGHHQPFGVNC